MKKTIIVPASTTPTTVNVEVPDLIINHTITGGTTTVPPVTEPPQTGGDININIPVTQVPVDKRTGWEQWHDWVSGTLSILGLETQLADLYYRTWLEADQWYSGTRFIVPEKAQKAFAEAKAENTKLRIGISTFDGGPRMPAHIWNAIGKAQTTKGKTVLNWNDPIYLNWVYDHCKLINDWIYANNYQDQVYAIDIRHYGQWGEWNMSGMWDNESEVPAGYLLSAKSAIAIIDAYIKAFPNFQLIAAIATQDRYRLHNTWIAPEVGDYVLKASNNFGRIGLFRDHAGSGYDFMNQYMTQQVIDQYKVAPIVGEPGGQGWPVSNMYNEIVNYHHNKMGNGNGSAGISMSEGKRIANAMGYRISVSGSITGSTTALNVNLNWVSNGIVPIYDKTQLVYDFGSAGQIPSSWSPRLFLGSYNLTGKLTPPAGWSTLTLKFVTPGRPDIIIIKLK